MRIATLIISVYLVARVSLPGRTVAVTGRTFHSILFYRFAP